jgi:hypothetical protein
MFSRIQRLVLLALLPSLAHAQAGNGYTQSNLVSDGSVKAQQTDTQLINPWGVAIGQQTPFWINTAGSGLSEVYDSGGNKQFVAKIPAAAGSTKTGPQCALSSLPCRNPSGWFRLSAGGPWAINALREWSSVSP